MDHIKILTERFLKNTHRHPGIELEDYLAAINLFEKRILAMEETGGEPDLYVIKASWFIIDSSKESPSKRVNTCYDEVARLNRKKFPPDASAIGMAEKMGIKLLDEVLYQDLQAFEPHDLKTSSWILTPEDMREKGGALFGDYRYGRVFYYHNGADSYYSNRGFRGYIQIK